MAETLVRLVPIIVRETILFLVAVTGLHAMARRDLRFLFAALVLVIALQDAADAQEIVLKEQLGQNYGPELLTYPMTFARQERVSSRSARLRSKTESLPAQFLNAELWSGTPYLRRARVAWISDLPAFAEKRFVIEPREAAQSSADLSVRYLDGAVELATSKFAVRLFHGARRYDHGNCLDQRSGADCWVTTAQWCLGRFKPVLREESY